MQLDPVLMTFPDSVGYGIYVEPGRRSQWRTIQVRTLGSSLATRWIDLIGKRPLISKETLARCELGSPVVRLNSTGAVDSGCADM